MFKRPRKTEIPERRNPGDREPERCSPGSIEQQLDMCEEGELRGEAVEHRIDEFDSPEETSGDPMATDREMDTYNIDMAEADREGAEMSGDEHSVGMQGDDPDDWPGPPINENEQTDKRQDPRGRHAFTRKTLRQGVISRRPRRQA